MNIRRKLLTHGVCISALVWFGHIAGAAESARQFAGLYEISDVIENHGSVQLTMTFTLLNPTGQTVNDGVITVFGSAPVAEALGKFGTIETLPKIGRAKVTETFKVSAGEYARWKHGSSPRFELAVRGPDGVTKSGIQARRVTNAAEASGT